MQIIGLTIQALEDIGKVGPRIKSPLTIRPLDVTDVCFMEGGTVSGKLSVFMVLKDKAGIEFKAEITEDNFHMIAGLFKGAVERFEDLRKQRAQKN